MDWTPQTLAGHLESIPKFWEHWRFVPWKMGPFKGMERDARFVKDGILGPVAQYKAWDYIVWQAGTEEERLDFWKSIKPLPDVMTQRFLFVLPEPWPERRIRSFLLGLKGYVEFYASWPGGELKGVYNNKIRDLAGLVELGLTMPEGA